MGSNGPGRDYGGIISTLSPLDVGLIKVPKYNRGPFFLLLFFANISLTTGKDGKLKYLVVYTLWLGGTSGLVAHTL